jgi:LmbE family N-acetylglucosaminyl deacetylase
MGGTLAKYIAEGSQVTVICATKGEVGEADTETISSISLHGGVKGS